MTLAQVAAPAPVHGPGWRRLLPHAAVVAGLGAATTYVWAVDPNSPGHYPSCFTYALTGVYCPGCGMLRATHDLTHLDLAGAMSMNPIAIPLYLAVGVFFVFWVRASWQGRRLRVWNPPRWFPALLVLAFVAFTVARNVPGWTALAPG